MPTQSVAMNLRGAGWFSMAATDALNRNSQTQLYKTAKKSDSSLQYRTHGNVSCTIFQTEWRFTPPLWETQKSCETLRGGDGLQGNSRRSNARRCEFEFGEPSRLVAPDRR